MQLLLVKLNEEIALENYEKISRLRSSTSGFISFSLYRHQNLRKIKSLPYFLQWYILQCKSICVIYISLHWYRLHKLITCTCVIYQCGRSFDLQKEIFSIKTSTYCIFLLRATSYFDLMGILPIILSPLVNRFIIIIIKTLYKRYLSVI